MKVSLLTQLIILLMSATVFAFSISAATELPRTPLPISPKPSVQTLASGRIVSEKFTFEFDLPPDFQFVNTDSPFGYSLFDAGFRRPNPDKSEFRRRDTPNGFNTAADDTMSFTIYLNRDGLQSLDIDGFREWLPVRSLGVNGATVKETNIGDHTALITIEPDGIDSKGQYFYFFGKEYIYVFGSDDFTAAQMHEFLAGFSFVS